VASLDGASLHALLAKPQYTTVNTSIPKFETACDFEMSEILKSMGMTDAFDANAADFSGLGSYADGNIYIGRVLHKTFLSLGEQGTRAGAATVVEMVGESAAPQEPKRVCLDRPFVYMLVDLENKIPFFLGTAMSVE
jgi:serpin B